MLETQVVPDFVSERSGERVKGSTRFASDDPIILGVLGALTGNVRGLALEVRSGIDNANDKCIDTVIGNRSVGDQIVRFVFATQVIHTVGIGCIDGVVFDPAYPKIHLTENKAGAQDRMVQRFQFLIESGGGNYVEANPDDVQVNVLLADAANLVQHRDLGPDIGIGISGNLLAHKAEEVTE